MGIYLNLSYTAFDFLRADPATDGLVPQSSPNYAYGAGSATNPASISVVYRRSTVRSFALTSLYYGCATIPPPGAASLPVRCVVTVTGYEAGVGDPVAFQEFGFEPAGAWEGPLTFGGFEEVFQGLEYVTFVQSPAVGTQFFVDNVIGSIET